MNNLISCWRSTHRFCVKNTIYSDRFTKSEYIRWGTICTVPSPILPFTTRQTPTH